jgi:hypothetical protein
MPYRIAGIDVHKKMLAVVVADVEIDGDFHFDRHKSAENPLREVIEVAGPGLGRLERCDQPVLVAAGQVEEAGQRRAFGAEADAEVADAHQRPF